MTLDNAWLDVALEDYEGHMQSAAVGQLGVLSKHVGTAIPQDG